MSRARTDSRIALTWRRLRGRFGISAPKVAVRTHVPWHIRLASFAGIIALLAMLAGWAYDAGRRIAGFDQGEVSSIVGELRAANTALEEEIARLRSLLTASESGLQIERAAQGLLAEKNSALALENAQLKEELAVFERLAGLEGGGSQEVSIDQLTIRPEAEAGRYRFSFLIALQGARRGKDSMFDLQVIAKPHARAPDAKIVFPRVGASDVAQYKIALRNFRRIEGRFEIPKDYPLETVEIRILERGVLKTSKSVAL